MQSKPFVLPLLVFCVGWVAANAQQFDLDAYRRFLQESKTITSQGLQASHPTDPFYNTARVSLATALYGDSISQQFGLTEHEKSLVEKHGFMVTERLSYPSFGSALLHVYTRDLPVFVSTDAVLHALHMSYDAVLKDIERTTLIPRLKQLLERLHAEITPLKKEYAGQPMMLRSLQDVDLYLTIPRQLLGESTSPLFAENMVPVKDLLQMVKGEQPGSYRLFAETARLIDFSQFTPRGHYTESEELTQYFQAMIWLGRTEIWLAAPKSDGLNVSDADIQRQTIDAALIAQMTRTANALPMLEEIDGTIRALVGESDNVTLPNVQDLMQEKGLKNAAELQDAAVWKDFQTTLLTKPFAGQRINSQILMSNPYSADQLQPATAFLLLGQRFVIDSYITGNVVYDKIIFNGEKMRRMLPSSLDVLFALGNNAAAQFLDAEMKEYQYAPNLAALRYLVDSYEDDFWNSSLYNSWLSSIRTLNPPKDRSGFPRFMQTAAWWQQKMNTQLASWAQLRHDNLLYAKQSYSGGITCTYPKSFVEPIPAFYRSVRTFSQVALKKLRTLPIADTSAKSRMLRYFDAMGTVMDTLESIATKELAHKPLSESEEMFLKTMIFDVPQGCGTVLAGWYTRLYYVGSDDALADDRVIADIHTAPTDKDGNTTGWVVHVATGPVNMAVTTCTLSDGTPVSFIGPVMSYYEQITGGFKRLTDEEWSNNRMHDSADATRPALVNLYLADKQGGSRSGEPISLYAINDGSSDAPIPAAPKTQLAVAVHPNPFTASTSFRFAVPPSLTGSNAQIVLFDASGIAVRRLLNEGLRAGNYSIRWDGTADNGNALPNGTYYYRLMIGSHETSGAMTLVRGNGE